AIRIVFAMCRNNIPAKSQRFQQKHFTEKRLPMICKSKKEKNHGETNAKKKDFLPQKIRFR
ncbi:MAG: hypothetical protein ACOCM2_03270, partial [Bacteroidales bacterium]